PAAGWPEPFRTRALEGRSVKPREEKLDPADSDGLRTHRRATLNRLLFPGPARECLAAQDQWGNVSLLPTREVLYGLTPGEEHAIDTNPGRQLIATVEAIGEPDPRGIRTVMCTLNGQLRPVPVLDRSLGTGPSRAEKADPARPGEVPAPYSGAV